MTHIHRFDDPRVFVFGSNRKGIHGAGAARYAANSLGAKHGIGEGRTGHAYALPTCYLPGVPLTLDEVREHVMTFLAHASENPDVDFFVSEVGCGLAGFRPDQIAPMFMHAPDNCHLPPGWRG